MSYKARINQLRRRTFRNLARNIRSPQVDKETSATTIRRVLIIRPNHRLGNLLLITPLIQEVAATLPGVGIDLFIKGSAGSAIFKNYHCINTIYVLPKKFLGNLFAYFAAWIRMISREYDLVINAVSNSSSGRLATKLARARFKISGEPESETFRSSTLSRHIALRSVCSFREFVSKLDSHPQSESVPFLDINLSRAEIAKGKTILSTLTGNEKPTVGLYTFATGAKCFPSAWWDSFLQKLEVALPGYNIIEILPVENVSQLAFRLPSFYSRDIREIGSVIANTSLFVGADSGIMHLASATGTPTIGLFSVTDPLSYHPYNPGSVAIDTRSGTMDEWVSTIRDAVGDRAEQTPVSS